MLRLRKYENWHHQFRDAIEDARDLNLEYGKHDCCCFVLNIVKAITGVQPVDVIWSTKEESEEYFNARGGFVKTVVSIAAACGLEKLKNVKFAQKGDIILSLHGDGALGMVDLSGMNFVIAAERGFVVLPMLYASAAWRLH